MDDVGRVRRLLRAARPPRPTTTATTRTCRCSSWTRTRSRPSRRSGTRWACAATSRARCCCDWKFVPERAAGRPGRRRRVLERRVGRPELPDRLVGHVERHLAGRDRHRHPPHHPQDPQGRRPARLRLPDHPGRGRRGDHGHERLRAYLVFSVANALDRVTDGSQKNPTVGRAGPRQLPALAVADQVQRGQERRPRGRQDAPLLRRHRRSRRSRCSSSATCATARPAG